MKKLYDNVHVGTKVNVLYNNDKGEKVFYTGYIIRMDHMKSMFDFKKSLFCVSCEIYFIEDQSCEQLTLWSKDFVDSVQTLNTKEDAWNISLTNINKKKSRSVCYMIILFLLLSMVPLLFVLEY